MISISGEPQRQALYHTCVCICRPRSNAWPIGGSRWNQKKKLGTLIYSLRLNQVIQRHKETKKFRILKLVYLAINYCGGGTHHSTHKEVKGQHVGVGSLFPSCGLRCSDSGYWAWRMQLYPLSHHADPRSLVDRKLLINHFVTFIVSCFALNCISRNCVFILIKYVSFDWRARA